MEISENIMWVIVGIMCIVSGGSLFIGAGIGYYNGYKRGGTDAARERDGVWKDRLDLTTANVERRMLAAYNAGATRSDYPTKDSHE